MKPYQREALADLDDPNLFGLLQLVAVVAIDDGLALEGPFLDPFGAAGLLEQLLGDDVIRNGLTPLPPTETPETALSICRLFTKDAMASCV